mmetsp:Transcript_40883/g.92005  ORF Transcript_40883/g.92005 Transcript_40883/m.92005 type:complete len:112 (-) Transcript_40883:228-563(-)
MFRLSPVFGLFSPSFASTFHFGQNLVGTWQHFFGIRSCVLYRFAGYSQCALQFHAVLYQLLIYSNALAVFLLFSLLLSLHGLSKYRLDMLALLCLIEIFAPLMFLLGFIIY